MNSTDISKLMHKTLAEKNFLGEHLDILHKILGIFIDFIAPDGTVFELYSSFHFNPYCAALRAMQNSPCRDCDRIYQTRALQQKKPLRYLCHAGMVELIVPVYDAKGECIGSLTSGQFRSSEMKALSRREISDLAGKYGLPEQKMIDAYKASVALTETQIEGIMQYLVMIGITLLRIHTNIVYLNLIDSADRIVEITKYIEKNYMNRLTITSVAKKFYLSPGYFAHFFSRESGTSFNIYLNRLRIDHAQEILAGTDLPIHEVVTLTGFGSFSQFNRSFKRFTGISPKLYRQQHALKKSSKKTKTDPKTPRHPPAKVKK